MHDHLELTSPSGEAGSRAHAWRIHHLPPNQPEILHAVLAFPEPGMYEAELQVAHEDTEEVARRFAVDVSKDGRATVGPQ
jgi:hypothetical protein